MQILLDAEIRTINNKTQGEEATLHIKHKAETGISEIFQNAGLVGKPVMYRQRVTITTGKNNNNRYQVTTGNKTLEEMVGRPINSG